jgi:hypothetical protein
MDIKLPPQKKTYKQKDKAWRQSCVDALDRGMSYQYNLGTRRTIRAKILNQNLYEGKLDIPDMVKVINPSSTLADFVPNDIQHQPIIVPKIDLLVGEELKRPFDWTVMVGDTHGISLKQEDKKVLIDKKITELISQDNSEEEIKAALEKLKIYFRYEWKDIREVRANKLLRHYFKALDMKSKFNEGFRDVLVQGEEIYQCDIQGNEPTFERLNPQRVHTLRSGFSGRIEESDVIISEEYWSPGRVIDTYFDQLKPGDIERISSGNFNAGLNFSTASFADSIIVGDSAQTLMDGYVAASQINGATYSKVLVDSSGNLRVLRCYWRSQKLVQRVTYFDDNGDPQIKIMSEEYIPDEFRGEVAEKLWVNEWWEGTKIADIYLNMRPKPVQYSRLGNPSVGHPGIVGEIYNYNQGKAISLLDRMKSYQYLYDIIWYRVNKAIEKNLGPILELDVTKKPANWDTHKWLYMAKTYGTLYVDPSREINKGPATGKTAGIYNTTGRVLDMDTGNYIQQHINLLAFIKAEMSEIVGITPQRQGSVTANETLGGVERAVIQSSNSTEWWFAKHEQVKLRALTIFLETAKIALRGNKIKQQHILDDFSAEVFEIDGDEFAEMDYDIFLSSEQKTKETEQILNQMAHAFMQNGGNLGVVMDILFSTSMADKRRRIELVEFEKAQQEQQNQEQALQIQQQQIDSQEKIRQEELAMEKYTVDSNNATKIAIEEMKLGIDNKELDLQENESKEDILLRINELKNKMEEHKDKIEVEKKKVKMKKVS